MEFKISKRIRNANKNLSVSEDWKKDSCHFTSLFQMQVSVFPGKERKESPLSNQPVQKLHYVENMATKLCEFVFGID